MKKDLKKTIKKTIESLKEQIKLGGSGGIEAVEITPPKGPQPPNPYQYDSIWDYWNEIGYDPYDTTTYLEKEPEDKGAFFAAGGGFGTNNPYICFAP